MGALEERALVPDFQQALQGLEIGAVSEPVAAAGQLHLLLVVDRNPGDNRLFDKVRDEIVEILRKDNTEKRFVEWSRELRDQAHIKILL
jgi:peptidyl-prolyl cis-trans isomerase SurA